MNALVDGHDAALFDLDGVVYLGPQPIPGAAEGIAALRERGVQIGYVTNNAARTPAAVAAHLRELGVPAETGDVVTSSQAGARMLADRLPAGSPVLVVGTDALRDEVLAVGMTPVTSAADRPAAVIQGYHPELPWQLIDEAGFAIQAGALWVATNTDSNRPTDRGLVAGAGAQIGALRQAVTVDPEVAGKPHPPLLTETVRRLGATDPIFVGDRLDTDIDGAAAVGMTSLLVFTGAHGKTDVVAATTRPDHLGLGVGALLEPAARLETGEGYARCGAHTARRTGDTLELEGPLQSPQQQLDALRALLGVLPPGSDPTEPAVARALARLDRLP
ncbi:HAD-IIA family hydrolase [Enemella evansiae]|uniref:HAD-IIA family hydrolase n=1 Tax=Enemella evansiae TaxID=2016499 RepID=UPI000B96C3B1|nr:HAD-IIA family hydrolase [Enemella evansiae]OYO05645.1 hydrolase [Enemella evansiae]